MGERCLETTAHTMSMSCLCHSRVYEGVSPLRSAPDNTTGLIEDVPPALPPSEVKALDVENDEQVT